ncbi:MAG: YggS family pyridoxal phosphate-dependent enzyme [Candidatus Omnitrophica bacterium]|nr:YggS family pyridoxal phosphate-dependent enzyme [Candidatus Omnitrophota bacterium]
MIKENIEKILKEVPKGVTIVAATKTRSIEEIRQAIECGITHIGENYVQEAEKKFNQIGRAVKWHLIGHLQKNKVKKAVKIFDIIETVDSFELAQEISKHSQIPYPVLIEVNSAGEMQKSGVFPDKTERLIEEISKLPNIIIQGLMTMGPAVENPQDIRPYFKITKQLFESCKKIKKPNVEMKILSMGMSDTWRIAIEEGATCIRIGTAIFGPRR